MDMSNDNNLENEKLQNVMSFYMLVNNLKYEQKDDLHQSIADYIYGTMILATAINSEYGVTNDLGKVLRMILLSEMDNYSKVLFNDCIDRLSMGKKYFKEVEECYKYCVSNFENAEFISFCKSLDRWLCSFFNEFLIYNEIETDDYRKLYELARNSGYFVDWSDDKAKNLEIFRFYYLNNKLKNKIRSGWDSKHWNINCERIETISEHVVGTIALAVAFDSEFDFGIDLNKVISTLCIHEIGEILIGDITPFDGITRGQKQEIEHKAIIDVSGNLSKSNVMINSIFEFDEQRTNDSKFAHYCDKLEADIQSKVYQDMGCHHPLTEQENNVVFKSSKVQKMITDGATTAFDIWYDWDKSIYDESPIFAKILKYVRNTRLK